MVGRVDFYGFTKYHCWRATFRDLDEQLHYHYLAEIANAWARLSREPSMDMNTVCGAAIAVA